MRYLLAVIVVGFLCTQLPKVQADELSLGLWSYHFDRDVKEDECTNEKHNLVAYSRNGFVGGYYDNSHCMDSYLLGYQGSFNKSNSLGYTVSVVSGYPDSMHVVDEYIVVPMVHYTHMVGVAGVRLYYIPKVLVATGLIIRF